LRSGQRMSDMGSGQRMPEIGQGPVSGSAPLRAGDNSHTTPNGELNSSVTAEEQLDT
jgi:hypothetical protein